MKQYPGWVKYKKYHRANIVYQNSLETRSFYLLNGFSGIQAEGFGRLTFRQLEACRRTLRRGLKKTGRIWIRPFTSVPVTKKSIASRMGKGKGNISHWIAPVRKGQVLFETSEWDMDKVKVILSRIKSRLPMKTKIISLRY